MMCQESPSLQSGEYVKVNELIDQCDLYASFVYSGEWHKHLEMIRAISPDVADAIAQYGIGCGVDDDGQYAFESNQLLSNLPKEIREGEAMEEAYDSVCSLAKAYAQFVWSYISSLEV
jgi:hypothetical protein